MIQPVNKVVHQVECEMLDTTAYQKPSAGALLSKTLHQSSWGLIISTLGIGLLIKWASACRHEKQLSQYAEKHELTDSPRSLIKAVKSLCPKGFKHDAEATKPPSEDDLKGLDHTKLALEAYTYAKELKDRDLVDHLKAHPEEVFHINETMALPREHFTHPDKLMDKKAIHLLVLFMTQGEHTPTIQITGQDNQPYKIKGKAIFNTEGLVSGIEISGAVRATTTFDPPLSHEELLLATESPDSEWTKGLYKHIQTLIPTTIE